MQYLENENGEVAVFDATNTTKKRRRTLYETIVVEKGFKLFFVESICFDESIIESNIREVKVTRNQCYKTIFAIADGVC